MDKMTYVNVLGISIKNRKVLLVKNENNKYMLPGGLIEFSKSPLETLNNKYLSQVGVSIRSDKLIDVISVYKKSKKIHDIGILYDIKINPGELKCEWLCIDELSKDIISSLTYEALILKGYVVK